MTETYLVADDALDRAARGHCQAHRDSRNRPRELETLSKGFPTAISRVVDTNLLSSPSKIVWTGRLILHEAERYSDLACVYGLSERPRSALVPVQDEPDGVG